MGSIMLSIEDKGKTFRVFGRRITRCGNKFNFSTACGEKTMDKASVISDWVSSQLIQLNGNREDYFIWINPHAARVLWSEGTLSNNHIISAISLVEAEGQRYLKKLLGSESCFICPNVPFTVGKEIVKVTVVISQRDPNEQVSIIKGEIPSEGVIPIWRFGIEMLNMSEGI